MQKTKFGISVGLCSAAMYFIGLLGTTQLIIAAAFILISEEDTWLKKATIKAVGVVIAFAILTTLTGLVSNAVTAPGSFLNQLILLFRGDAIAMADVNRVIAIINNAIGIVRNLLLLALGFKALKQGTVGLGPVDKVIDANM